jgi:hypothetical protein
MGRMGVKNVNYIETISSFFTTFRLVLSLQRNYITSFKIMNCVICPHDSLQWMSIVSETEKESIHSLQEQKSTCE